MVSPVKSCATGGVHTSLLATTLAVPCPVVGWLTTAKVKVSPEFGSVTLGMVPVEAVTASALIAAEVADGATFG